MESEALKQLYQRYRKEIYLYLYSLCRSVELAEDLTQETFLKALLSLSESHGNMRAWLYMVARNLYFNVRRNEKAAVPWEELAQEKPETESDLLSRLLRDEQRKRLFRALGQLEARKRELLQLQYFGGLSQKEIAAILRLTPANVRVLALRARRELKYILEVEDDDIS